MGRRRPQQVATNEDVQMDELTPAEKRKLTRQRRLVEEALEAEKAVAAAQGKSHLYWKCTAELTTCLKARAKQR